MTVEERLEKLEREAVKARWRIRLLSAGVAMAVGIFACVGASYGPRSEGQDTVKLVRAEKFEVVDSKGKVRAWLTVGGFGPSLGMMDENDVLRAQLCVAPKQGPMLCVNDENFKARVVLTVKEVPGPEIRMINEKDELRTLWGVDKNGPLLGLLGENGKPRAFLRVVKDESVLILSDENSRHHTRMTVDKDGPALGLYDANGKTIWSAPK